MVTPMTSAPCSTSSAAATDESTPPLMPTTMRSAIWFALVPRAEQLGQPLELVRRRVADLDLTLSLVADNPHARHQAPLQRFLEGRELDRPPPPLARRQAAGFGDRLLGANRALGGAPRPIVRQDLVGQLELPGHRRQREQRARVAHRQPPTSQVGLNLLREPQQPQTVRDRRAVLADPLRELLLRPREFRQELLIGLRRLDRVQVLAQEILDQRELDALCVRGLAHDCGNSI